MANPVFPYDPEMPFALQVAPDTGEPGESSDAPDATAAPEPLTDAEQLAAALSEGELLELCRSYKNEAMSARQSGVQARDAIWSENLDLYHQRMDFTGKHDWQHKEVSARGKKAVDRFAAACKRALMGPGTFYDIVDPSGQDDDIFPIIRKIVDTMFETCSLTMNGHVAPFAHVFARSMKIGALMLASAAVSWDTDRNRLAIDVVDPRELYLDPKGRGLYRLRQRELDRYEVEKMPFVNQAAVAAAGEWHGSERESERNQATGHTEGSPPSGRGRILVDEFLFECLLDRSGNVVGRNVLVMTANDQRVIRGPEPNPYWHESDWIVAHPLIDSPLSIYGGTYFEDFASLLRTFSQLTNLILDGVQVGLLANFALRPSWLQDPSQVNDGMRPFKLWLIGDEAVPGQSFIERLELGRLGREAVDVWQGISGEFREASSQNEIGLGQVPPKGQITATEIQAVGESQSELVQDIAEGIDGGFIAPLVRLNWYTTLQHVDPTRPAIRRALGDDIAGMLLTRRDEFRERSFAFRARAVSGLAKRQMDARNIMAFMQVLGQNPAFVPLYQMSHSPAALFDKLIQSMGMDEYEMRRRPSDPAPILPSGVQAPGMAPPAPQGPPAAPPPMGSAPT